MASTQPSLRPSPPQPIPAAETAEQRAAPRLTLLLRQAKLRTRGGEFLCVIRDVSETGLSIRTFHPLPPDKRLAIELREDWPFQLEKVWEKDGEAGFRFRDPVDLDELLAEDARFPKRQIRIRMEMSLTVQGQVERAPATISNLSQQGACIASDATFARDELVKLETPLLPAIHAKIRWRKDDIHGLVFEETFGFRDFACLLASLQGLGDRPACRPR